MYKAKRFKGPERSLGFAPSVGLELSNKRPTVGAHSGPDDGPAKFLALNLLRTVRIRILTTAMPPRHYGGLAHPRCLLVTFTTSHVSRPPSPPSKILDY